MPLDRERAREVLDEEIESFGYVNGKENLLDRLEECVLPDETWDWWMARRIKAAEAKLATIRALLDSEDEANGGINEPWYESMRQALEGA